MDLTIIITIMVMIFSLSLSSSINAKDLENIDKTIADDDDYEDSSSTSSKSCSLDRKIRMDRLVNKILAFGEGGRTFPENERQLKPFCNETNTMIKSIEDYFKQCERRDTQDLANVFLYSIKHVIRTFCKKRITKKVQKFFEVAPCLNKYVLQDVCISGFAQQTKPLIIANIGNDKTKHICCNYIRAMDCVDQWIMERDCSKNYRELLNEYVHGIFDNMINFMCGEINEDSDRCERVKPLKPLNRNQKKTLKPYESFMFIVMDVLESLNKQKSLI